MLSREILVCVTYREFDGGSNSLIQEEALNSLKNQTYQNFRVVLTNFNETTVVPKLKTSGLKCTTFQSEKNVRLCWTEVVTNGFNLLEKGRHILLWCPGDTIFDPNFFEEIAVHFKAGCSGTSFPQLRYKNLDQYKRGYASHVGSKSSIPHWSFYNPNLYISDFFYVDGDTFLDPKNQKLFREHEYIEHLPGFGIGVMLGLWGQEKQNLVFKTKAHFITNDRDDEPFIKSMAQKKGLSRQQIEQVKEDYWSDSSVNAKMDTLESFCRKRDFPEKFYRGPFRKWWVISQFRPNTNLLQAVFYWFYLWTWKGFSFVTKSTRFVFKRLTQLFKPPVTSRP